MKKYSNADMACKLMLVKDCEHYHDYISSLSNKEIETLFNKTYKKVIEK